jgi:hypothetical protein
MRRGLRHRFGRAVLFSLLLALSTPSALRAADQPTPNATAQPAANATKPAAAAGTPVNDPNQFGIAEQGPFEEKTTIEGKIETDLQGVWLLIAYPEIIAGKQKYRSFTQILKISQGKDGLEIHIVDAKLPDDIEKPLEEANRKTMVQWVPSAEVLQSMGKNWSKYPLAKTKNIMEFLYGKVTFTVSAPDKYDTVYPQRNEKINKALEGSKFSIWIVEDYKPRDLPPDTRISQLMRRTTVYGAKSVEKDVIKGDLSLGFMAAGGGFPLPFEFVGTFTMYRIAPL